MRLDQWLPTRRVLQTELRTPSELAKQALRTLADSDKLNSSALSFIEIYEKTLIAIRDMLNLQLDHLRSGDLIAHCTTSNPEIMFQIPQLIWIGEDQYRIGELEACRFNPTGLEPSRMESMPEELRGRWFGITRPAANKWLTQVRKRPLRFLPPQPEHLTDVQITSALRECDGAARLLTNDRLRDAIQKQLGGRPIGRERFRMLRSKAGLALPSGRPAKSMKVQ